MRGREKRDEQNDQKAFECQKMRLEYQEQIKERQGESEKMLFVGSQSREFTSEPFDPLTKSLQSNLMFLAPILRDSIILDK